MIRKIKRLLSGNKSKKVFNLQYEQLKKLEAQHLKRFELDTAHFQMCLYDSTEHTAFDRHYVYHPAWAVRILKQINPAKHIDISSTLHFCSMLSAFMKVDFYDYRPANLVLPGLSSIKGDLMNLPFDTGTVESISCMHTVEHIGLGRYGDPLDYNGDIKAIDELKRVLAVNGNLLFVVPLGAKDVIYFNAHRIYTKEQVLSLFSEFELKEFTLIPEDEADGGLVADPGADLLARQTYGCGCFWFTKV